METMKQYLLTELHHIPFLLPYGQAVAAFARGFRLNEAGALVVESLDKEDPFSWYAANAGLSPEELPEAREDYDKCLRLLSSWGCLKDTGFNHSLEKSEPFFGMLQIGPLAVRLNGAKEFFSEAFAPFLQETSPDSAADKAFAVPESIDAEKTCAVSDAVPDSGSAGKACAVSDAVPDSGSAGKDCAVSDAVPDFGSAGKACAVSDAVPDSGSAGKACAVSDAVPDSGSAGKACAVPETVSADQTVTVTPSLLPDMTGSVLLVKSADLEVFSRGDLFFLRFPAMRDIRLAVLTQDGAHACYFVTPQEDPVRQNALKEDLFHAIRQAFLVMAQHKGFFALHSATILYRDKVFAFSGPSGTGKSTHAALWKDQYRTPLLNGDLSLLSLGADGKVLFHGMPWCGTSGITTKRTAPLFGVVFLKQAAENRVEALPPEQQVLRLLNRLISPVWTREMLERNLHFSREAAERIATFRLHCTKEPEAASVMKEAIDRKMDGETNRLR